MRGILPLADDPTSRVDSSPGGARSARSQSSISAWVTRRQLPFPSITATTACRPRTTQRNEVYMHHPLQPANCSALSGVVSTRVSSDIPPPVSPWVATLSSTRHEER